MVGIHSSEWCFSQGSQRNGINSMSFSLFHSFLLSVFLFLSRDLFLEIGLYKYGTGKSNNYRAGQQAGDPGES